MPVLPDHAARLSRAQISLHGLATGDAFGERFFVHPQQVESLIEQRALPSGQWRYTDDTVMALAITEVLEEHGYIEQDALARLFADKYARDRYRGYGGTAHDILADLARGADFRQAAGRVFDGQGSMGNGGAMRAGPIGAYYAGDPARAAEQARRSAEVTHAHPEGQAGAIAVAVAAAHVASGASTAELWAAVLDHVPESATRSGILRAQSLGPETDLPTAVELLGNGSQVLSQDTVPFALWCAGRHAGQYAETLWATVAGLGDRDTNCAIVGSIVVLADDGRSIPREWLEARESLDTLRRSFPGSSP